MTDGTRTRDVQDHNLALYQLSYGHRLSPEPARDFYRAPRASQHRRAVGGSTPARLRLPAAYQAGVDAFRL